MLFNVAELPHAVPDLIGASLFVEDAAIGERLLGVDDRFERFVLDLDQLSGIVGEGRRFGDDGGYRFSLITDLVDSHRVIANLLGMLGSDFDERLRVVGHFLSRDRADHAGKSCSGGSIDADDPRMCVGRAHEAEVEHFAELDVVGKFAAAAQEAVFFLARQ